MNDEDRLGRRTPPLPDDEEPQILDAVEDAADASNRTTKPQGDDSAERPQDEDGA